MNKEEKARFVEKMNAEFKDIDKAFLFDYRGLSVAQVNQLRKGVKNINAKYQVVKNTLAKLAIKGTPVEELSNHFEGPVAIAWTKEDPVSLAKSVVDFAKETKKLEFKAGILDGKVINEVEFKHLSSLPGREELIAKVVYLMNAPVRGLATTLSEISSQFVRVLAAVQRQKESQ